ncbi:hypothetical protein SEVIR_1G125750v4 [Setaria viridis]
MEEDAAHGSWMSARGGRKEEVGDEAGQGVVADSEIAHNAKHLRRGGADEARRVVGLDADENIVDHLVRQHRRRAWPWRRHGADQIGVRVGLVRRLCLGQTRLLIRREEKKEVEVGSGPTLPSWKE